MSYGASIYSHGCNPPIALEVFRGICDEQRRLPSTTVNSAPSQHETEAQLVMDRLLRECLQSQNRRGNKHGSLAPEFPCAIGR
jgi:hypothetical protein